MPSPPADIQTLLNRLHREAMIVDQRRIRPRLQQLERQSGPIGARLDQIAADLDRSAAWRARRAASVPKPDLTADLPILARQDEIAATIAKHQVTVICGETGSGKTTQLPQICLTLGRGVAGMIGHTQPRRIAARAVAARIAEELGTTITPKGPVGYKVRFGDETSDATLIKLMTDGILLSETQGDRDLLQYDTIIIDEAHERSLNIDFLLGYLKQLLPRRPDLKIIITSATIDPQRLSNHFGGPTIAPVIEVSGRTYPVEVRYKVPDELDPDDWETNEERAILDAVDELTSPKLPPGDILLFLPGEREIRLTTELLRKSGPQGVELVPLYARLSPADQQRVFAPHRGKRIVLATNVAETSLTVPGIRYVIDTGLARISRYSHRTKVQRLPIEDISQASAAQRSGRCGRVAAGIAIRLYTEQDFKARPPFTDPEIIRTNLASVILQMKSLRLGQVEDFPFVEPPDSRMIKDGYETLHELGAIDDHNELTDLGRALARLPVDPRIGRMILAGVDERCLSDVLVIASALSVQDPRDRPMEKQQAADAAHQQFRHESSDFLTLLLIWTWWSKARDQQSWSQIKRACHDHFLSFNRMREWEETHNQLRRICEEMDLPLSEKQTAGEESIHRALLTGLLSNILQKNEVDARSGEFFAARGNKAFIFPGSTLFKKPARWVMSAELVLTTKLYARTNARIQPEWIEKAGAHLVKRSHTDVHFHAETGRVSAWERVTLFGLVLVARRRIDYGKIDPKEARDIFIYDALVNGAYETNAPFAKHNATVLEEAQRMEAKLRRHDLIAEKNALHTFWDKRLPADIHNTYLFEKWRTDAEKQNPKALFMTLPEILPPDIAAEADDVKFPDYVPLGQSLGLLDYALDPGKPADGITLNVPLETLSAADPDALEWLVPGMLTEKILALLKSLPKQYRTQFVGTQDAKGDAASGLATLAKEIAAAVTFGKGRLAEALTEAADALRGVAVPREAWPLTGLPDHLRMNVRVLDEKGGIIAESRDVGELKERLSTRARKALQKLAQSEFGTDGITEWTFGDDGLPEKLEIERAGATVIGFPCLIDAGDSVSTSLADTPQLAARLTRRGLIRLYQLQCKDELAHRLRALPEVDAMYRHYAPIGDPAELKRDLMDLIAEQTFLNPRLGDEPRTKQQFEDRLAAQWGRLGTNTIEIGKLVINILANRHRIAHKLSSGTPKIWEQSIADLREHAAWLLPPGVFHLVPLDRLQHYPRYVEGMWKRLEKLRESGTAKETSTLPQIQQAWKRYTGWIASAHAEAKRQEAEANGETGNPPAPSGGVGRGPASPGGASTPPKPKSALPTALGKRSRIVIATDAAAWSMHMLHAGLLPPELEAYRWLLEEFRVSAFAQELGTVVPVSAKRLEDAWGKIK